MTFRVDLRSFVLGSSGLALLFFLWGVLLDWHFVVGEFGLSTNQLGFAALVYVALIGGWFGSLLAVRGGSRRAQTVLLVYALLLCAYALQDLVVYCPETCPGIRLYFIANWGNLILGGVAALSIVLRIRSGSNT